MKAFKILIGIIFVVASLLKLAAMWNILHWSWFERVAEEPWANIWHQWCSSSWG